MSCWEEQKREVISQQDVTDLASMQTIDFFTKGKQKGVGGLTLSWPRRFGGHRRSHRGQASSRYCRQRHEAWKNITMSMDNIFC